jgi:hypothetical protein
MWHVYFRHSWNTGYQNTTMYLSKNVLPKNARFILRSFIAWAPDWMGERERPSELSFKCILWFSFTFCAKKIILLSARNIVSLKNWLGWQKWSKVPTFQAWSLMPNNKLNCFERESCLTPEKSEDVARAGLGSKPGIFRFCLFSHSITLPLSHSGSPKSGAVAPRKKIPVISVSKVVDEKIIIWKGGPRMRRGTRGWRLPLLPPKKWTFWKHMFRY